MYYFCVKIEKQQFQDISIISKSLNVKALKFLFSSILMVALSVTSVSDVQAQEDYSETVMHHISNANEFHVVGDIHIPLPCILYAPDNGFKVFMSNKFHHGSLAIEGYVLDHGTVKRIKDFDLNQSEVHLDAVHGEDDHHAHYVGHNDDNSAYVFIAGKKYDLEKPSTLLNMTSWFDFSISKNVFSMLLATLILFLVFGSVSRAYKTREGKAPKGLQSLLEPIIIFIRDEVAIPAIGHKWEKFFPFLLSLFFFILINNIFGLIPFFPFSANVTGNVATTMALAIFVFLVTNLNGNKHYWEHTLWMPGIPTFVKFILTPIEVLGLFIKPFTLFIRLFANITAGHIIILSLIGLIWTFGDMGENIPGSAAGAAVSFVFVAFMNLLELFVAFLQAFIFTLLAGIYIGSAVEEGHHHEEHAH